MLPTKNSLLSQFDLTHRYHSQGLAAGGSALLDAINKGKVHLAKFILDAGEYNIVNTKDFKGKTPLIRACYIKEERTRDKAINMLIENGADVNLTDDRNRTSLMYACEMRCNDIIMILLKTSVDPDIADIDGNTALLLSAESGNDVGIEILIRCFRRLGLNVDHVNKDGMTALMVAAKNGFIQCATTLAVDGRACISRRDPDRRMNAEEWARSAGCSTPEVLSFSVHAGLYNYRYDKINSAVTDNDSVTKLTDDVVSEASLTFAHEETGIAQKRLAEVHVSSPETDEDKPIYSAFRSESECDESTGKRGSLPSIPGSENELCFERCQTEKVDALPSLPKIRPRMKESGRSQSTSNLKVSKAVLQEEAASTRKAIGCQGGKSDQGSNADPSSSRGLSKAGLPMGNGLSGMTLPSSKRNTAGAPKLSRQHSQGNGLASASRIKLDLDA